MLHLARIALDPRALGIYAGLTGTGDEDGCYAVHHALRKRFGNAAPQPFHAVVTGSNPHLVGYLADADALAAACDAPLDDASPAVLGRVFPQAPETRPMPVLWATGAALDFRLRARPVVRYSERMRDHMESVTGWRPQGGEIDAFVAAARRTGAPVDHVEVCRGWLSARLDGAAEIETLSLDDYRRIENRRSAHGRRGKPGTTGPDARISGQLRVLDKDLFGAIVAKGVGRHAAFGFGMMMLTPVGTG